MLLSLANEITRKQKHCKSASMRLMFVDAAMQAAYEESIFDEGYDWLRELITQRCTTLEEIKEVLTDANFHDVVDALPE